MCLMCQPMLFRDQSEWLYLLYSAGVIDLYLYEVHVYVVFYE